MTREPVVAGQFYPSDREELLNELSGMIPAGLEKTKAIGAVVPHAGYPYSGAVAGAVYARLAAQKTYIILGPNHTGNGECFAACRGLWRTPLGIMGTDEDLLTAIMRNTSHVTEDPAAHLSEHSIEVQLPFIQQTAPGAGIVSLTLREGRIPALQEISAAIVSAIREEDADVVIIASSDMTHYESREAAREKDHAAIQAILDLDGEELVKIVKERNISMCGYIPVAIMLMCAKKMGAKKSELIKYCDSGDVSGDTAQVVGYAGVIVS
ncbi:MAG: AmmeMemoRadiSam system protein B [Candidatus Omnitrophota bacterium]